MSDGSSVSALDRTVRSTPASRIAGALVLVLLVLGALAAAILLLPLTYRIAVTLGLVQGLGEFLPISSSAHLILTPWFLGWPDPGLAFDVALHVGTLAAVVIYFWRDWLRLLRAAPRPRTPEGRLFWLLLVGSIPGGIAGVLLDDLAEQALRSPLLIAGMLALMGLGLLAADRRGARDHGLLDIGPVDAALIGMAQALAIVPGVSRSGITIAMARVRGVEREAAARFSFLLGSPIIAGAALFKLRHLVATPDAVAGPFLAGVLTAAVAGALSIGLLLRYLREAGFGIFVVYRLLLAALALAGLLLGLR
ncbi:MAG: undecaprenyl-diphosphate phosphatase [Ardenticatenaceae bacterium]|nr:undecaprenyl-diphosphate phosphatase [Ardenticatenaceae bacterium]